MKRQKTSKNVKVVLDILRNEIDGDVSSALKKMTKDYTMTWVYQSGKIIFPNSKPDFKKDIDKVYLIKGREYDIKNIAEGENVVMMELVESYPDPKSKKIYRTPLVLVLEMKDGKIKTGRHYCDPLLSSLYLDKKSLSKLYKRTKTKLILK